VKTGQKITPGEEMLKRTFSDKLLMHQKKFKIITVTVGPQTSAIQLKEMWQ